MDDEPLPSPLRDGGAYLFRGKRYTATHLREIDGKPCGSTALIHWPLGSAGPQDIVYLRHGDGILLSVTDFQPIGTLADLVDTGQTDVEREES